MAGNTTGRMTSTARVIFAASMLALIVAQSADARVHRRCRSDTRNHYTQEGLGLYVGIGRLELDSDIDDFGARRAGPGLMLGLSFGLSEEITIFGSLTGSGYESDLREDWSAGYAEVGLKYSLVSDSRQRAQPYFLGALGGAILENDFDHEYYGGGGRLAGGIDYFLTPGAMFFLEAGFQAGHFEEMRLQGRDIRLIDEPDFNSVGIFWGLRFKL